MVGGGRGGGSLLPQVVKEVHSTGEDEEGEEGEEVEEGEAQGRAMTMSFESEPDLDPVLPDLAGSGLNQVQIRF